MEIILKNVEPFNIPPVNDHDTELFLKHLTGNEIFEFEGEAIPKGFLIYDLKYNYPRHCYAHGWLINADINSFIELCNSGIFDSLGPILRTIVVGTLGIEIGGNINGYKIYSSISNFEE